MGSFATINRNNISISPVRVTFDGVDLGAVEGDVTVTTEVPMSEIKVAQLGATVVDMVSNGGNYRIKMRLIEVTAAQIKRLLAPMAQVGSTGVYAYNNIGDKFSNYAKQLVIHPLGKNDADKSQDWLFYKAVATGSGEIPYGNETITGFEIEFVALPDFTVSPARFGFYGDPAIGAINASAAAAVAGANTGNGTVSGIAVSNANTKTETITLTCVDEGTNAGEFHVTGSNPARSLGIATVGVLFNADDSCISFTINDGATDFVEGDSFTIATTAANYI